MAALAGAYSLSRIRKSFRTSSQVPRALSPMSDSGWAALQVCRAPWFDVNSGDEL
ncbi:MAG: hypothetical protein AB1758_24640 [Candidatus Eremiobacterota bacterium]